MRKGGITWRPELHVVRVVFVEVTITALTRTNIVKHEEFSERLRQAMARYHSRTAPLREGVGATLRNACPPKFFAHS